MASFDWDDLLNWARSAPDDPNYPNIDELIDGMSRPMPIKHWSSKESMERGDPPDVRMASFIEPPSNLERAAIRAQAQELVERIHRDRAKLIEELGYCDDNDMTPAVREYMAVAIAKIYLVQAGFEDDPVVSNFADHVAAALVESAFPRSIA